jgi:hypothetical protein
MTSKALTKKIVGSELEKEPLCQICDVSSLLFSKNMKAEAEALKPALLCLLDSPSIMIHTLPELTLQGCRRCGTFTFMGIPNLRCYHNLYP